MLATCEQIQDLLDSPQGAEIDGPPLLLELLSTLLDTAAEGSNPKAIYDEIFRVTAHKSKLIQIEQQILHQAKTTISVDQAKALVMAITNTILTEVDNFQALLLSKMEAGLYTEVKNLLRQTQVSRTMSLKVRAITADSRTMVVQ
jgi:hypothetical protein